MQPGARTGTVIELGSAAPVLRDAAVEVADDPVPTPEAGQWVSIKDPEIREQADGPGEERGGPRETGRYAGSGSLDSPAGGGAAV
ncbi:hypothetical protein, partial [Streptomyces laculatispora]|uniref:hypothetical protein n=1 Tax=Streptomyces laculatispora TaxID=887464 RepID=UPI001A952E0B